MKKKKEQNITKLKRTSRPQTKLKPWIKLPIYKQIEDSDYSCKPAKTKGNICKNLSDDITQNVNYMLWPNITDKLTNVELRWQNNLSRGN